jgi:hypothetical protein
MSNINKNKFKYAIVIRKLEEAFSIGASISEACMYANISRDTYYRWIANNKAVQERFEALLEKPILTARQSVVGALKTNPKLALKYLERKRKKEFSPRMEMTGEDGQPLMPQEIKVTFQDFSSDEHKSE